jgi:starch phosphorylase
MEEVSEPNIYMFGLTPEEVRWYREQGNYHPRQLYEANPMLRRVMDSLAGNRFCPEEHGLFRWIVDEILDRGDRYFLMADLPSYIEASRKAEKDFQEPPTWASKAILNVARVGRFSSDRTIQEYARDIWGIQSAVFPPQPGSPMAKEPLSAEVST